MRSKLAIFGSFFRRAPREDGIAAALYGAIVAQARNAAFYTAFCVPDTIEGRFELLVLHMAIALPRFRQGGAEANELGQAIFDLFCDDMDRSLRELGVGDLGVPKRMKRIGQAFYGRSAAYEAGLAGGNAALLTDTVERNVFGGESAAARPLAEYALAAWRAIAAAPENALLSGHLTFPDPAPYMTALETR